MPDIAGAIALTISVAAFGFSLLSYFQQRSKDRRDLFLSIHQTLIEPDLQQGRRLLNASTHDIDSIHALHEADPAGYQQINRALAMFDIFSMYVNRKYVNENLALEEWGHTVAHTWVNAQPFIAARERRDGYLPWAGLRSFGPRAVEWASNNPRSEETVSKN